MKSKHDIAEYVVCHEKPDNGHEYEHTHAVIKFSKKIRHNRLQTLRLQ